MILSSTSPAAAMRYTPPWYAEAEKPPVYLLRAGSPFERELVEAELAGEYRAAAVWPWDLFEAAIEGFQTLGGADAEHLIALAEADRAEALESDHDKAVLKEAFDVLAEHWPAYRTLLAQASRRDRLLPLVAFRRFCVGWENVDAPFERGFDKCLTSAAVGAIDPLDLRAAGREAFSLLRGDIHAKNSDAPSKSADAPATSSSGAPSTADGSSPESITQKTPD